MMRKKRYPESNVRSGWAQGSAKDTKAVGTTPTQPVLSAPKSASAPPPKQFATPEEVRAGKKHIVETTARGETHLSDIANIDQKELDDAVNVDATADQVATSELHASLKKELEWERSYLAALKDDTSK